MERIFKIIMHTHWDREWYFTKDETKIFLKNHMIDVIEFLEKNQDIIYILDGQSVMIDDFLEFSPNFSERLKKLVQDNRLKVGPFYTQTDLLIVNGESIIRNLYYGIKRALDFGNVMKVGYAPDTFGHSSQMPQIYKEFGIESTFFWRGFSELKSSKSDFLWKGIDGSIIYGVNLATGYQGAKYLEEDKEELQIRMDKLLKVLDKYSTINQRLIMNGHDQMPIQKNIYKVIKNLKDIYKTENVEISSFEDYILNLDINKLDIVEGELTHSKHSRIHKTIGSTRMDIKLLNSELEYKIYNVLEPIGLIGESIGLEYPKLLIEKCLKELFGIHAHDSIGGCNSDFVNSDIKQRLIQVKEKVDTQIELYKRLITLSSDNKITLYNLLPYKRTNEIVEIEILTRTKNFYILDKGKKIDYLLISQEEMDAGVIDRQVAARLLDIKVYKSKVLFTVSEINGLSVKYLDCKEIEKDVVIEHSDSKFIENKFYKIFIENNEINLVDKKSDKIIKNILHIESSGDGGDSYDYSPPYKDLIINENHIKNIRVIKNDDIQILNFDFIIKVPFNQKNREKNEFIENKFNIDIKINNNKLIKFNINHKNITEDTRYRLAINTDILSEIVEVDGICSILQKPVYLKKELSIWEKDNWAEKPVSIETYNSFVSLFDKNDRATIFSKGLKEYEVIDKTIYITLFRTFSHLGKRNLINRPNRPSGIEIETPDNQLKNIEFNFEFALLFGNENLSKISKEFLSNIESYQLKEFNRFNLNNPNIMKNIDISLEIDLKSCVVSALKKSENDESIFLRIFNPYEKVELNFETNVYLSNMFEEKLEKVKIIEVGKQKIVNLIIERN